MLLRKDNPGAFSLRSQLSWPRRLAGIDSYSSTRNKQKQRNDDGEIYLVYTCNFTRPLRFRASSSSDAKNQRFFFCPNDHMRPKEWACATSCPHLQETFGQRRSAPAFPCAIISWAFIEFLPSTSFMSRTPARAVKFPCFSGEYFCFKSFTPD